MKAIDIMVRDVVTVTPDDSVSHAVELLAKHDISALPVVDGEGRLTGVLSEADLIHRVEIGTEKKQPWWVEAVTPAAALAADFAKAHGRRVHEIMSTDVVTAGEDAPLAEIAALLERHRIKRVPIVRDGKLIGIVSRSNLIQALASSHAPAAPALETDRSIRQEVMARLAEQKWSGFDSRNVIVHDGNVHLWGLVSSKAEREALLALAEEVPGVTTVTDEMIPAY